MSKVVNLLIFALFLTQAYADPTNSTWNYDSGGDDWKNISAKCAPDYTVASPVNFHFDWSKYGPGDYFLYDWAQDDFSFLPNFRKVKAGTYGFDNWVWQASTFDSIGFYAAEALENP